MKKFIRLKNITLITTFSKYEKPVFEITLEHKAGDVEKCWIFKHTYKENVYSVFDGVEDLLLTETKLKETLENNMEIAPNGLGVFYKPHIIVKCAKEAELYKYFDTDKELKEYLSHIREAMILKDEFIDF